MAKFRLTTVQKKSRSLEEQVKRLAADTKPVSFPPATGFETYEDMEVRRAEKDYWRAVAKRVWTRLSREHRAAIRRDIFTHNTFCRENPESSFVDTQCVHMILDLLDAKK